MRSWLTIVVVATFWNTPFPRTTVCQGERVLKTLRISRSALVLVVVTCGAPLLLAGCGSQPTAAEPSREAGNLGVRVCLVNNTTLDASVVFTVKDTAQEGAFPPGSQLCGEGTFGVGNDVAGNVVWATPSWTTGFQAENPWIGQPEAFVTEFDAAGFKQCLFQSNYKVNESMAGDNAITQVKVTRVADDQWKEFEIVFTPSANPSADGRRVNVKGWHDCADE